MKNFKELAKDLEKVEKTIDKFIAKCTNFKIKDWLKIYARGLFYSICSLKKEIGEEKTSDLKEALTILLNLEFKDLWFVEDKGYDKHQELRKFISEEN